MQVSDIERWIRRDPAGRGLFAFADATASPCAGHLAEAARELATQAKYVGIVTGFFVPDAPKPAAETDGPIGATLLADALHRAGIEAFVLTDEPCASAVRAVLTASGVDLELLICPVEPTASRQWRSDFWRSHHGRSLTHLLSVERVGPSLTDGSDADRCRNMRGTPIDDWSADLYRLFEQRPAHVRTIGMGDGGNEIGMGTFWNEAARTTSSPANACRTCTDWTILAGVSDWAAMALAAACVMQQGDITPLESWTPAQIQHALEHMVTTGPAIDGCTLLAEPTVDGLPFATYIQPWEHIRRQLALDL